MMVFISPSSAVTNLKKEEKQEYAYHLSDGKVIRYTGSKRRLFGFKIEIVFRNGDRRFYNCKNRTKKAALKEASIFVESMEKATGGRVAWKFTTEDFYRLGPKIENHTIKERIKQFFNDFFEID